MAEVVVLVQTPVFLEIPPLGAIVEKIESGGGQLGALLYAASQGLGEKLGLGFQTFGLRDEASPKIARDLIGRIGPKPHEAQAQVLGHHAVEVVQQSLGVGERPIFQFCQISPHRDLGGVRGVDGAGVLDPAVFVLGVPLGMLGGQGRVDGRVVDHQVQHHFKPPAAGLLQKVPQGRLRVRGGLGNKERIETVVILDGIEAAGQARGVNGVKKDPGPRCGPGAPPTGGWSRPGGEKDCRSELVQTFITSFKKVVSDQWSVVSGFIY